MHEHIKVLLSILHRFFFVFLNISVEKNESFVQIQLLRPITCPMVKRTRSGGHMAAASNQIQTFSKIPNLFVGLIQATVPRKSDWNCANKPIIHCHSTSDFFQAPLDKRSGTVSSPLQCENIGNVWSACAFHFPHPIHKILSREHILANDFNIYGFK